MKRWEMVAKMLGCGKFDGRRICNVWQKDPSDEIDLPPARDLSPARDLGLDIAAAQIVTAAKGDDEWCATLLLQWERLTGRVKEGQ